MTTPLTEAGRALHHELHAGCAAFKRDCPMSDAIAAIEAEARERRERVDPDLLAPLVRDDWAAVLADSLFAAGATFPTPTAPGMSNRDALILFIEQGAEHGYWPGRRERVDPDLRMETAMDEITALLNRWEADGNGDMVSATAIRSILAATEAPQIEGHYPGCSGVEGECACAGRTVKPATPDHTEVGEER